MEPEDEQALKNLSKSGKHKVKDKSDAERLDRLAEAGYVMLLARGRVTVYALTARGRAFLDALQNGNSE